MRELRHRLEAFLGRYSGPIYAAFRIVTGLMFVQHGVQNLFGWLGGIRPDGGAAPFLSLLFFAGLVEFFGGLLVAVGLQTSWAAFLASGQMAVAYWWKLAPQGFFPIQNRGELAVLYCFAFLYIASHGGGAFSLDAIFRKPENPRVAPLQLSPPRMECTFVYGWVKEGQAVSRQPAEALHSRICDSRAASTD